MIKRGIKIVILFVLLLIILAGGGYMYKKLEYNKQTYAVSLYDYVSPNAVEVINVNKDYDFEKLYLYNPSLSNLINPLAEYISYPLILSRCNNGKDILICKIKNENVINKEFLSKFFLPFPPHHRKYKNADILLYSLADDDFFVLASYKGMIMASKSYQAIEDFIDTDPENTFFSIEKNKKLITDMLKNSHVSMYVKMSEDMLAVNYMSDKDTIRLEGYILDKNIDKYVNDSLNVECRMLPFRDNMPSGLCVEDYAITNQDNLPTVKIILNKMY